jgi:hypothetical protein
MKLFVDYFISLSDASDHLRRASVASIPIMLFKNKAEFIDTYISYCLEGSRCVLPPFSDAVPVRRCRSLPHVEYNVQDATLRYGGVYTWLWHMLEHITKVGPAPSAGPRRFRSHVRSPVQTSRSLAHVEYDCSGSDFTIWRRVHISFCLAWGI